MRNMPVAFSKNDLIAVLEDMLMVVREDDSFEGSIEYLMPEPPEGHLPTDVTTVTHDGKDYIQCGICGMGLPSAEDLVAAHAGDPKMTAAGEETRFMVRASYRVGNSMGQGGLRMIGELR